MKKSVLMVHRICTILAWGIFVIGLIRTMVAYPGHPAEIGVHFAGNGEFDLIDAKWKSFYPLMISAIVLLITEVVQWLSGKVKAGFRLNEAGEQAVRSGFVLWVDLHKVLIVFFYGGVWVDCVVRQHGLNTLIPIGIIWIIFAGFVCFVGWTVFQRIRNGRKKQ